MVIQRVSQKASVCRQGMHIPSCMGLTAFNVCEKPDDRDASHAHCLLLPSSPSQISILSTGLPQNNCFNIPLEGNDLTDLDQVFCNDVQHLPVNFLSWQDYKQCLIVLHWLLFTSFLICFSSAPYYMSRFLLLICCNITSLASYHFYPD